MEPKKPVWNSLEATKVLISVLTPLAVAGVGYWIQSTISAQAQESKVTERLIDRRLAVYDEVRLKLNRIYCFVEDVGSWKTDTPESIAQYRREIHAAMHTNRAIWSPHTFNVYLDYMDRVAFKTYIGPGKNAAIRTVLAEKLHGIPASLMNAIKITEGNMKNFRSSLPKTCALAENSQRLPSRSIRETAVPSRSGLTGRSSRRPQVSLVGALRTSRSGAAYLGR